jgi:predicted nucleic acid-binding protein
VLERENKITPDQATTLLSGIASFVAIARLITPNRELFLCRDPEDNMLLECCLAAQADLLITGDRDLLAIPETDLMTIRPELKVMSPQIYLKHK